jgi:hypothetical protein
LPETGPSWPSREDIAALGQSLPAKAVVSDSAKQAHVQTASPSIPVETSLTRAVGDNFHDAKTEVSTLVQKALHLEKEFDELLTDIKNLRGNLDRQIEAASLRSHEQTMVMLCASNSQVRRWRKSRELKPTWLDSHPRYKIEHIKAFIDSRTQEGRPIKQATVTRQPNESTSAAAKRQPKHGAKKAKTKKKELS